ncbi:MAG: hypothetical protein E7K81_04570 [Finegoldia magna]|uniref:hypothetical protein n=2 Tax=Finegoldia magna TaxID=1260 RepID=UPI0029037D94|nr:hypothetical protein [Finegoldia magna]MDU2574964.1 hypothetical protein [Finegoldia magna]MDU7478948.1 hypothetical protein [Finegoldia magna]
MDDKKQDFKQNLKNYVSDEKIAKSDDYFEEKPVNVGVNDDVNGISYVTQSQESTKSTDDVFEEISQKYTQKERKEDNEEYENYKQNDSPDWYLKCVKFISVYADKIYDFYASTKHGIIYSFLTSGLIAALTSAVWVSVTTQGSLGELSKVFHKPTISIMTLILVPLINYVMTRFIYMFTKKYMRPTPPPCTRDVKGGVFSIINGLFMFILTPLGFIGSIIGCFTGMVAYSATFLDLYLEKDSFKVGLKSFIAQIVIKVIVFVLEMLLVALVGILIYNSFSNMIR